jgi:hypothetical protein
MHFVGFSFIISDVLILYPLGSISKVAQNWSVSHHSLFQVPQASMTYMRPNDEAKLQQGGPWTQYMPETHTQQGTV